VCAARVRQERSQQIGRMAVKHLKRGGGLSYFTGTLRHHRGQRLSDLWDAMNAAWSGGVVNGRAWVSDRDEFGIVGYVKSPDVTYGENGWHPHLPVLIFTESPLDDDKRRKLRDRMYDRWSGKLDRMGYEKPFKINCPLDKVRSERGVSDYIASAVLKEGGVDVGFEVQRHDRKRAADSRPGGGRGSMTPFQILRELSHWPDDGELRRLWLEYERATADRKSIHWSGLAELREEVQAELDEEAEQEAEAVLVEEIDPPTYYAMLCEPGGLTGLLECVEGLREESPASYIRRFYRRSWGKPPEKSLRVERGEASS